MLLLPVQLLLLPLAVEAVAVAAGLRAGVTNAALSERRITARWAEGSKGRGQSRGRGQRGPRPNRLQHLQLRRHRIGLYQPLHQLRGGGAQGGVGTEAAIHELNHLGRALLGHPAGREDPKAKVGRGQRVKLMC